MDAIRGIGFDVDHTLAIDNRLERVAFLRLLEPVLVRGGHTVGTLADEIDAIDGLLKRQRHGDFTIDEAVALFVAERGLECTPWFVESFRTSAVGMIDEFLIPLPGVKLTLAALEARGIAVAVLTNGWSPFAQRKAERAGFGGRVLVSTEIGERKPSPRAFEMLLEELGTPPHQTAYVGDDPRDDVAGAHDAGIQTVWMNWERLEYPAGLPPPQHTIAALPELLELVPQFVRAS